MAGLSVSTRSASEKRTTMRVSSATSEAPGDGDDPDTTGAVSFGVTPLASLTDATRPVAASMTIGRGSDVSFSR